MQGTGRFAVNPQREGKGILSVGKIPIRRYSISEWISYNSELERFRRKKTLMNIEYLQEFVELAKHLSITDAARALNMRQPTLSKHIAALEKELGIVLFERSVKGMRLTRNGTAFLTSAYEVVDSYQAMLDKTSKLRKAPPLRLTVSGLTDEGPSTDVLGFLVSVFAERFGADFLETKPMHNMTPHHILKNDLADIVYDPLTKQEAAPEKGFTTMHVGNLSLIALVAQSNPLAAHEKLPLSAFKSSEIIHFEGIYISRSWHYIQEACERHGFSPQTRSRHFSNTAEMLTQCANLGSSVLIVGKNFANRIPAGIKPFCTAIQIEDPDVLIPFYFLYKESNENPLLQHLVNLIRSPQWEPLAL